MIKETSLLHFPDYRGTDTPYDEYIFDDERGKIGFFFDIMLSDGTHVKFPNTGAELNIFIPPNTDLYIERFMFRCSKDFDPGVMRFQPYFQKRSRLVNVKTEKTPINNNKEVDKDYINDLIFTKETKYTLKVEGELIPPQNKRRRKAKEDTVYELISYEDEPQLIGNGGSKGENYTIGIRITNHWDVKFNGAYHNKLYMLNDDCDGFIWEKYHEPNDYIILFAEWYASYYWHNKEMILYPNDKYAIPTGMTGIGTTNRGGITRNFFVRGYYYNFYDIGGNWYVTKDGHDWVWCKEKLRPDNSYANWTIDEDKGIFHSKGHIYLASIENNGQIHFEDIGLIGDRTIIGDGNGYLYFTNNKDPKEFKDIYAMDYNGSVYKTCLQTSEYTYSRFGTWNKKSYLSGTYKSQELRNQRFVGVSTDGFKSITIYSTINHQLPNYGDQFGWHVWENSVYWSCRRKDPNNEIYYYDIGNLGSGSPFKSYLAGTIDVNMELCGMSSNDASKAYYRDYAVSGKYLQAGIYVPDSPSLNSAMYFKDGKPSYPFGHLIRYWSAWNNVIYTLVIGECNRHSASAGSGVPPWNGAAGSFAFDLTYNYMIDPDNETWIYPYA